MTRNDGLADSRQGVADVKAKLKEAQRHFLDSSLVVEKVIHQLRSQLEHVHSQMTQAAKAAKRTITKLTDKSSANNDLKVQAEDALGR